METFETRLAAGANNIDLLRLLGALVVLYVHSFILTGVPDAEPSGKFFRHATEIGPLAVGMFFTFSGFLVARSALRSAPADYARARAVRLYPALVTVLLLQALVLGPAISDRGAAAYLADPATWAALGRGLLLSPPLGLPGVFPDNPVPLAVNGSLWTLRFEAFFWLVLAVLARFSLLGRRPALLLAALGLVAVLAAAGYGLKPLTIASYAAEFFIGVALFAWRAAVPHRAALAVAAAGLIGVSCWTGGTALALCLALPYLYAFPIQQLLVALLGPAVGPWGLTALALPPTLACAVLSRRWVERPCQDRFSRRGTVRARSASA